MKRDKTVMLVVAFVAVIAVVGFMTFNRYEAKQKAEQKQAQVEKEETKEEVKEEVQSTNTNKVEAEITKEEEPEEQEEPEEPKAPTFSKSESIIWPIDGNVILNYSMDQTIYFPTLDQYKYNPALIIAGEEGKPVVAAADGIVKKIYKNPQTGITAVMDLGNGYEAIYGQLQEPRLVEGQRVAQGDVIGYVSSPTKYYSTEGPNVYFQMLKEGEPVNPLEYMKE